MKTTTKIALATAVGLTAALGVGDVRADDPPPPPPPPPVASTLLARGTADELSLRATDFKLTARQPIDLAFVKATIIAGGATGWHLHPGPSVVIVQRGMLTMRSPHRRHCMEQAFGVGEVFEHPAGVHNFIAGSEGVEFYVSYFVPVGAAPLLTPAPAPAACP